MNTFVDCRRQNHSFSFSLPDTARFSVARPLTDSEPGTGYQGRRFGLVAVLWEIKKALSLKRNKQQQQQQQQKLLLDIISLCAGENLS